jgi:transposase
MESEVTVLAVGERTLSELAAMIRQERDEAGRLAALTLEHVARAGELLAEARKRVKKGTWQAWVQENVGIHAVTAAHYMLVARFREEALDGVGPEASLSQTMRWLRAVGLHRRDETGGANRVDEIVRREAVKRLNEGAKITHVAAEFGVSTSAIRDWENPERAKARWERSYAMVRQARHAEKERQIKQAVKKQGGARAELYAMAERMQDVMGQAHREATDSEERRHYARAGEH